MKLKRRKSKKAKKEKLIKRHEFTDMDDEKYALAFMLMDDGVLEAAHRYYEDGQLKLTNVSQMYKRQFRSVLEYYEKYHEAPRRTIKYIQEGKKATLTTDELEIDQHVLDLVAAEYVFGKDGYETNSNYIMEVVLPRLIRTRKIQSINQDLIQAIDRGFYEKAEQIIEKYEVVTSEPPDYTYGFKEVLTQEYYNDFQTRKLALGEVAFQWDKSNGDISKLMPQLRKQWLVSVIGNTKSGKSYFLWRMAMDAAINQGKKVLFLSPEMPEYDMIEERTMPFITGNPQRPYGMKARKVGYWIPVIDCLKNQVGACPDKNRINARPLFDYTYLESIVKEHSDTPQMIADKRKWVTAKEDKHCMECLASRRYSFEPTVYFKHVEKNYITERAVRQALNGVKYHNASNLKVKFFPKYSVTIDQQLNDIRRFMDRNKWSPDIIFWDYLDISKLDLGHGARWEAIDNIWKTTSGFLQEMNALGVSAEQSTQLGRSKRLLDETITSEASMKDHHIDFKMGIIKYKEETKNNICRVNVIYDRHSAFERKREVLITQDLNLGDALTDSIYWTNKRFPPYPLAVDNS
jgi:hypothetical protein